MRVVIVILCAELFTVMLHQTVFYNKIKNGVKKVPFISVSALFGLQLVHGLVICLL
jgi:hypothetical protein